MKKAIFKNFIIILILALLFSGSIFSIVISDVLLDKTKVNMLNILQIMDQSLDYDSDLGLQINELNILNDHNKARLTILDSEGNVIS